MDERPSKKLKVSEELIENIEEEVKENEEVTEFKIIEVPQALGKYERIDILDKQEKVHTSDPETFTAETFT